MVSWPDSTPGGAVFFGLIAEQGGPILIDRRLIQCAARLTGSGEQKRAAYSQE
jgi:hypothetical protein